MTSDELTRDRAWFYFRVIAAAQVILWTLMPALTFQAPPLDVAENIMWGREWVWGTYKHPPLQAWITDVALVLSGNNLIGVYFVSQICIVLTWLALFRFALETSTPRTALLSVCLFSLVYYSNVPSVEFNANVLQMPIWAWSFYLVWRCIQDNRLRDWVLLGVIGALAVYAKYSAAILVLTWLVAFLAFLKPQQILLNASMWAGALVATALVAPHLYWLHESAYLPLQYAEARSLPAEGFDRVLLALKFLATQALDHAGTVVVLLCLAGIAPFRLSALRGALAAQHGRLVAILAFAPLFFTVLWAITRGVQVKDMWGAPMVTMISLLLAMAVPASISPGRIRLATIVGAVLLVLAAVGVGGISLFGSAFGLKPQKTAWPQSRMVSELVSVWEGQVGTPLRIVAGPTWPAALVVAGLERQASGFIDCSFAQNPWITRQRIDSEGMLVVWSGSEEPECLKSMRVDSRGEMLFEPGNGGTRRFQVYWALQKPVQDGRDNEK